MSSDDFLSVKEAARRVGRPKSFSTLYKAVRDGRIAPDAVRQGARGLEIRLDGAAQFFGVGVGVSNGANTGVAPVSTPATTPKNTRSAPARKSSPRPTPPPAAHSSSPAVAALRDELEYRRLKRSLDRLEEVDEALPASLIAERQRRQWAREDEELARRREERAYSGWIERGLLEARAFMSDLRGAAFAAEHSAEIEDAARSALFRLRPAADHPAVDDDVSRQAVKAALKPIREAAIAADLQELESRIASIQARDEHQVREVLSFVAEMKRERQRQRQLATAMVLDRSNRR